VSARSTEGVEPVEVAQKPVLPPRARPIHPGLRLNINGRTVRLRGLRRTPTGIFRWLAMLGPGLIAGAVSNDAGSIATYSQTGARYGYELLWVVVIITVSLAVVQEMSARLGAATGRGLLDLIRERFGMAWATLAVAVVLIANGGLVLSEFVGIGAAAELFGVSRYIAVPVAALLLIYLITGGSYSQVEKLFIAMALLFLAYPVAAILAHPPVGQIIRGALVPTVRADPSYITLLVGLIGTTISPYQQVFQQSAVVEKGVAPRHYDNERLDTYMGMVFSNLVSAFIIIATAATLYARGQTSISSAADAARALVPVLGPSAGVIFGVGLLGASLMAAGVLPLATAYSIAEAFGLPKGMSLGVRRARGFFALFAALLVLGAALALIPNLPVIQLLVGIQVINGVLLPVVLVFIMLLANDGRLMRNLKNTRLYNILGWGTVVLVVASVLVLLGQGLLQMVGVM
jgi:NRAMP (natural resistance-associated macrophage protein)-like metal ion transporter